MGITRRDLLAGGTAMAAAGIASPALAQRTGVARRHRQGARPALRVVRGMEPAGRCYGGSFANPAYAALLERDCGLLVAENEFKRQRDAARCEEPSTSTRFDRDDRLGRPQTA